VTVAGIFTIIQQRVNAQPEEPVSSVANGILRSYNILADTKTGTTSLADNEILQEMQQAAEETGEEFILLEHTVPEHTKTITLYSYDIKGQIIPSTSLPDELEPIADFPNRGSLQEADDVRTALEDRIAVATENSSDQSEDEGDITEEEDEERDSDDNSDSSRDDNSDSSSRGNNDDDKNESGERGDNSQEQENRAIQTPFNMQIS
jgi:hypothetical protein